MLLTTAATKVIRANFKCMQLTQNSNTGREDECETAAEIYQCGREKSPLVTGKMYNQSLGNATLVRKFNSYLKISY